MRETRDLHYFVFLSSSRTVITRLATHCESKVNVLTPAEVTDLLLELKLLHKTRKPSSLLPSRTLPRHGLDLSLDSQE